MAKILVTIPFNERHKERFKELIQASGKAYEVSYVSGSAVTEEIVKEAEIIIGNVKPDFIKGSENLKWMQLNSAGTDGYTKEGVLPEGCFLTNATGAYGLAISEHLLAMTLSLMKHFPLYHDQQNAHVWKDGGPVPSIYGSTTLVVGLGDIGSEYAYRMHALGSYVVGIRKHTEHKPEFVDEICTMDELKTWLPKADIVALCLPNTKETTNLMNEETLSLMKQGAILLNIGRGSAIDQKALKEALDSGHLGGAGIDVSTPEPLPADDPLWDAKNILITPHISGGFHLPETFERIVNIALRNFELYAEEKELTNQVDFKTGYRKYQG